MQHDSILMFVFTDSTMRLRNIKWMFLLFLSAFGKYHTNLYCYVFVKYVLKRYLTEVVLCFIRTSSVFKQHNTGDDDNRQFH